MATIRFLGTSGSVVTKERMCAGVLFDDKLIDVGFGVLANLMKSGTSLDSINDVYISHTHSDHVGDFTGLVWSMAMENRTRPLRVVSSVTTASMLRKVLRLQSTPRAWLKFDILFVRPKNAGVEYVRTVHSPETLAYRFKMDGCDFVYGADTSRSEKMAEFAAGCDLLVHDSTFLDGQESIAALTHHSTARDAGRTAKLARANRLFLTHFAPTNRQAEDRYAAEAAASFDGEIAVARDDLTTSV